MRYNQVFSHGGDTGDMVYALPTIKTMGGGQICLVKINYHVREPFSPVKVESLRRFLEAQPYITRVEYSATHKGINLDEWRNHYSKLNHLNLADKVAFIHQVPFYPRNEPWLYCNDPNPLAPVVIARSPRWHNDACPWRLIRNKYHTNAVFIGLPEEHTDWQNQFGTVRYQPTVDWWERCRVIAGARLFIGNQSALMAIALGLCVPQIIQEVFLPSPNCHFERPGVHYIRDNHVTLPDY